LEKIENYYRSLYRIRRTEERIAEIYPTDKIKSPIHLSIGQEAISVGICEALSQKDIVFGTYRGHAMYLAKGGSLNRLIAELYGKQEGCSKGKGGSMHIIDVENGIMGTSAIVGTTIPISVGYAYALKLKKSNRIVVSFFGDGAVDEGAFHESLNFAALKKVPILFVCENNRYAIQSHHLSRHLNDNIFLRAKSYGILSERIDHEDVIEINRVAEEYIAKIRENNGPVFLECYTCRWKEHVGPNDDVALYRDKNEIVQSKKNDQLNKIRLKLNDEILVKIESEVDKEINEAIEFAEKAPFPERSELYSSVFYGD
jgi:TPP-dependent pyruvate/acetoin dehydrogenase alpha subunit